MIIVQHFPGSVKQYAAAVPFPGQSSAIPTHFVLVLDDYQLVHTRLIHDALAFLLDHQPPQMHLLIAVSTVRSHIKHIYGKLDAHSRYEAVERAKELDLFHYLSQGGSAPGRFGAAARISSWSSIPPSSTPKDALATSVAVGSPVGAWGASSIGVAVGCV